MSENPLVNRKHITSTLRNELMPLFDRLAKDSRVPKSRLLDEAIEDLLRKHGIEVPEDKPE